MQLLIEIGIILSLQKKKSMRLGVIHFDENYTIDETGITIGSNKKITRSTFKPFAVFSVI